MEPVKKPAGGAFGEYCRENRLDIAKQMTGEELRGKGAVLRRAGEIWKAMSEENKAPYVKRFEEHTAAYKAYAASDGLVPKEKKEHQNRMDSSAFVTSKGLDTCSVVNKSSGGAEGNGGVEHVKRPAGGAFGEYLRENRLDIAKMMGGDTKGKGPGAILKRAGEIWKEMSDKDKAPYVKLFEEHTAAYKAYAASGSLVTKQANPEKKSKKEIMAYQANETTGVNDEKASAQEVSPAKKQKLGATGSAIEIDAAVLKDAQSFDTPGFKLESTTLMARLDSEAQGPGTKEELEALRSASGQLPGAKHVLLGA